MEDSLHKLVVAWGIYALGGPWEIFCTFIFFAFCLSLRLAYLGSITYIEVIKERAAHKNKKELALINRETVLQLADKNARRNLVLFHAFLNKVDKIADKLKGGDCHFKYPPEKNP